MWGVLSYLAISRFLEPITIIDRDSLCHCPSGPGAKREVACEDLGWKMSIETDSVVSTLIPPRWHQQNNIDRRQMLRISKLLCLQRCRLAKKMPVPMPVTQHHDEPDTNAGNLYIASFAKLKASMMSPQEDLKYF